MAGDANYASVALLLHGEGSNNGTVFTDSSNNAATLTKTGSIVTSTAQALYGSASISIPSASGQKLQLPAASAYRANGQSWTLEVSIYCAAYSANKVIFDTDNDSSNTTGFAWYVGSDGKVYVYQGTTASNLGGTGAALTANTWTKLALTWDGTTLRSYKGGTKEWETTSFANPWSTSNGASLFCDKAATPAQCLNGYADEFRFTKGVARYTGASYTPDSAAFLDYAGQVSGNVKDSAGSNAARTVRAYRRDTGALVGSTTSNGTTGNYTINCATLDEVTVIALDNATSGTYYNDQAARVIPA